MSDSLSHIAFPESVLRLGKVTLAHGGGGELMQELIRCVFLPAFGANDKPVSDAAEVASTSGRLAFTTDSYVVSPLFFPGGDIGKLAVYGTVNDLATSGAKPRYLSAGFILEEGLSMETLWRVVQSMAGAAEECDVRIVTGDTKVVERGKGDGLYVNTAGVGLIEHDKRIAPESIQEGDAIIVSGDLGRHGAAIMAAREGLKFATTITSDCAPLHGVVLDLVENGIDMHCVRDLTRGGLGAALDELAFGTGHSIELVEAAITVSPEVQAFCEVLGLDVLHVANEGRMVVVVAHRDAERAVEIMHRHQVSEQAMIAGEVGGEGRGMVTLRSMAGTTRIVRKFSGEQLPRIC